MKRRSFTLDQALENDRAPLVGDVIVSARTVRRVVDVRPVESRVWPNRWRLTVDYIGKATNGRPDEPVAIEEGRQVITTSLYRRGEGPVEFFGPIPA